MIELFIILILIIFWIFASIALIAQAIIIKINKNKEPKEKMTA